ncbi:hypothetical protein BGZ60DRAFT_542476, partial [Tricladium varicosporioides]
MELQNAVWPREVVGETDASCSCKSPKRGLLVRMGIHFGNTSCYEVNPVTGRTAYYGTML